MDFYQSFLSFCTKAGKSPSRVALDNGFSKTIVSGWKSGRTNPTDRTLAKLAEYFGVTVDELVSGEQKVDKEETDAGSRSKLQEQYDSLDRHGQSLIGHASAEMLRYYQDAPVDDLKKITDRL